MYSINPNRRINGIMYSLYILKHNFFSWNFQFKQHRIHPSSKWNPNNVAWTSSEGVSAVKSKAYLTIDHWVSYIGSLSRLGLKVLWWYSYFIFVECRVTREEFLEVFFFFFFWWCGGGGRGERILYKENGAHESFGEINLKSFQNFLESLQICLYQKNKIKYFIPRGF